MLRVSNMSHIYGHRWFLLSRQNSSLDPICPEELLVQSFLSLMPSLELREPPQACSPVFRRILPVTEDILLKWWLLMENGRKSGHTYSHPDLLLTATALQHELTVVTRDRRDFDKAGVSVFNLWEQ